MASYNLSGPGLNQLKSKTDTVNVTQIRGEEALSEPFRYEVRFTVEEEELQNVEGATPNFDEVVGKTVTLELAREKRSRTVAGIVTKIQQDGIGTGGQLSTRSHLMVIRPTLWRLHLSRSNRTFSNRKAVTPPGKAKESRGVLNVLLRKAGYGTDSIETDLTEKHENRKRVSQKGETDLEFFDRVAQEAGVVYYFKGNGTLMLVDHDGKNAYVDYERSAQTGTKTTNTLRAVSSPQKRGQEGVLDRYSLEQNVTPSYVEARAVDFNQSATVSKMAVPNTEADTMGSVQEAGGHTWEVDTGPTDTWTGGMQSRRMDQVLGGKKRLRGHTHSHLLGAGMQFALEKSTCTDVLSHFDSSDVGFILNRLRLSLNTKRTATTNSPVLHVEFEAVPSTKDTSQTYRGDRYLERRKREGGESEQVVRRLNALATKYSGLRNSMVSLEDVNVEFDVTDHGPRGGGEKAEGPLLTTAQKNALNIPSEAKGVEEIDPYAFDTEASAGPPPESESGPAGGIYAGTVEQLPEGGSSKAKQGMVKIRLDLDGEDGEPVWARVVTPWAGHRYGQQFMPRKSDRVAVMYPAQDAGAYPFVVGGLYDGNHSAPFADKPGKKDGIRSHSVRSESGNKKHLYNEISMNDEPGSEELRSVAPNKRTDVTGIEREVGDASTYFAFKKGKAPSGLKKKDGTSLDAEEVRAQFNPTAPQFITEEEKNRHMPSKSDKVCELKPIAVQIKVEYEGVEEGDIKNKKVKKSDLPNKQKTKFKIKEEIGDSVKKELKKNITLEEFMYDLSEEKQGERKMKIKPNGEEKNIWWYTVENEEEISEYISYEAYSELGDTVKYTLYKEEGGEGQDKSGKGNLADDMQKASEGTYASIKIKDGGAKPLYEVVGSREAYEVDSWGYDAYDVHPYKELYPDKKKIKDFKGQQGAKRTEYTEGGAIDACQGTYRIHSFGDRLEVFKASKDDQKSVFEQEVSEEWEVEDLPGEHDQFEDDDPIMVLNEDGSIVIQSSEGINIESSEDINIQSSGSINMYAEESIEQEAEEEISEVAKEIKIGDEKETHSIEQRSIHHFKRSSGIIQKNSQEAMTIKNEHVVLSHAQLNMSLCSAMHVVGAPFGLRTIGILDSSNKLIDFSISGAIKNKISTLRNGDRMATLENDLVSTKKQLAGINKILAESGQGLMVMEERLAQTESSLADTETVLAVITEDVIDLQRAAADINL